MFTSVQIQAFRGFHDLKLEGLGRVNLIVGKNNTGKTSLLEALTLLADPRLATQLPGLFRATPAPPGFYPWLFQDGQPEQPFLVAQLHSGAPVELALRSRGKSPREGSFAQVWSSSEADGFALWGRSNQAGLRVHAVSIQNRAPDGMIGAFADAVRAPKDEEALEQLLRAVDPRVKSVRLDAAGEKPFIAVDVGLSQRIPLAQAGQGLYRLVGIFSELLGGRPQVCLIDEIENGVHHSALTDIWRGLAEAASRLDVQVFVTTHSRECLTSAHRAYRERASYDLRVIQLYRLPEGASGRVLDAEHVEAAIEGDVELR